jgi:hypothetical protein
MRKSRLGIWLGVTLGEVVAHSPNDGLGLYGSGVIPSGADARAGRVKDFGNLGIVQESFPAEDVQKSQDDPASGD